MRRSPLRSRPLSDHKDIGHFMTVKELIKKLQQENPDALVYTMNNTEDIAFAVTDVDRNVLAGKDETVLIH